MSETPEIITRCDDVELDIRRAMAKLDRLPPSRGRSLVQTKLDEAVLWLSKCPEGDKTA